MTTQHDSETPAHGQQVFTACAFIHREINGIHQVFLAKRAATKKFLPGVFELPGGHVDYGEEMVSGLVREIKEEFEADITVGDPFAVFTYQNAIKGTHSIEVIYFARFTDGATITLNPEDHSEYQWVSEDQLSTVTSVSKPADDLEFAAITKGFALLRGEPLTTL